MNRRRHILQRLEPRVLLAAQPYDWQNVNIGAGGFVDGIFFDPAHQNTIYARTDIGGLFKTTDGGNSWRELLDFEDNTIDQGYQRLGVLSFALNPRNTSELFLDVGMYNTHNGWVLHSTDGGQTFSQTNLPFWVGGNSAGRGTGERLADDPNLGSTLFLGSNDHGLYKSIDSAASFSPVTSFPVANAPITFVYFDPRSGSAGTATQTLYVGVASTNAGTNIYRSTNGGANWSELPGGPTNLMPMQAALASDGNLYFTFSNALPPDQNITSGAVWRYNTSSSVGTSISPVVPNPSTDHFGYDGIAVDPGDPNGIVVTSFDRYSGPDTMWRTSNASAATPTWYQLFDPSSADNFGFNGNNKTRTTSTAPWVAAFGDGIGNWAAAVAIDPFNSAHLMYGTGQGIWATDHANSPTKLTAANSWYFPDTGIEFTAVNKVTAAPNGSLFSAMGDIDGFVHTSVTTSPTTGSIGGTITGGGLGSMSWIDFAQSNPNIAAIVGGTGSKHGAYTTNNGATWSEFAAQPSGANGGKIAVSASGATFVWVPSSSAKAFYSANNGTSWTAASFPSGTLNGGTIVADRVDPARFYYWTENSSDNQWTLYSSTDTGHTFTKTTTVATGNVELVANPLTAGDLWIATYIGLYHSTNFGATFNYDNATSGSNLTHIALGKAAPTASYPAIFVYGTLGGATGVFRSDDSGATFTQVNDATHQFGGLIQTIAADPNVYGRVYMGINGRGIVYGDIHIPPHVTAASYLADTSLNKLSFTLDQDVPNLQPTDLTIAPGGLTATSVTFDTTTHTATFTIPSLADGNYTASLSNAAAGLAEYDLPFFVLRADANRDGTVNALDFNVIASNFGSSSATLATGDINYDGRVDAGDFTLLAQQFAHSVPQSTLALSLAGSIKPNLFASHPRVAPELMERT